MANRGDAINSKFCLFLLWEDILHLGDQVVQNTASLPFAWGSFPEYLTSNRNTCCQEAGNGLLGKYLGEGPGSGAAWGLKQPQCAVSPFYGFVSPGLSGQGLGSLEGRGGWASLPLVFILQRPGQAPSQVRKVRRAGGRVGLSGQLHFTSARLCWSKNSSRMSQMPAERQSPPLTGKVLCVFICVSFVFTKSTLWPQSSAAPLQEMEPPSLPLHSGLAWQHVPSGTAPGMLGCRI